MRVVHEPLCHVTIMFGVEGRNRTDVSLKLRSHYVRANSPKKLQPSKLLDAATRAAWVCFRKPKSLICHKSGLAVCRRCQLLGVFCVLHTSARYYLEVFSDENAYPLGHFNIEIWCPWSESNRQTTHPPLKQAALPNCVHGHVLTSQLCINK